MCVHELVCVHETCVCMNRETCCVHVRAKALNESNKSVVHEFVLVRDGAVKPQRGVRLAPFFSSCNI